MGEPGRSKTVLLEFSIVKCRSTYICRLHRKDRKAKWRQAIEICYGLGALESKYMGKNYGRPKAQKGAIMDATEKKRRRKSDN
ncbi:hypothetical protein Tco_0025698 [Tanacetum coccineum]